MLNINYLKLLQHLRASAKKRNIEFSLTEYDLLILPFPVTCPILNIPIKYDVKGHHDAKPSIDRIDNTKGYVAGNLMVISVLANRSKNSLTEAELKTFSLYFLGTE